MNEQVNEQASAANDVQIENWVAGQIRAAILLGLSLYTKQAAAEKAGIVGGNGVNAVALECAAYVEAAIWRLKSVQENGGQGTRALAGGFAVAFGNLPFEAELLRRISRPTKPNSESQVGGGVPSAPQDKKVNLVVAIEGFLAAEHAAGRIAALGYWSAENQWVSKTAAQFVKDLKSAYAQRAAIRHAK